MLRCILPLLGLALLAIFAALYAFDIDAYFLVLTTIGIKPLSTHSWIGRLLLRLSNAGTTTLTSISQIHAT